jgi:hypothetical protein
MILDPVFSEGDPLKAASCVLVIFPTFVFCAERDDYLSVCHTGQARFSAFHLASPLHPCLERRQTALPPEEYIIPHVFEAALSQTDPLPNFSLRPPATVYSRNMTSILIAPPSVSPLVNSTSDPRVFVLPDLFSHCTLDLRVHEELPRVVWESKAWMINGSDISRNEKAFSSFHGLKAGGLYLHLLHPR